jgi:hypothetical protein
VRLHAYQFHVFLDFEEVIDYDGTWGEIARRLNGGGVRNIHIERRRLELAALLSGFAGYVHADSLQFDGTSAASTEEARVPQQQALETFLDELSRQTGATLDKSAIGAAVRIATDGVRHFENRLASAPVLPEAHTYLLGRQAIGEEEAARFWRVPMAYALLEPVNAALRARPDESWLDAWLFSLELETVFHAMDGDGWAAWQDVRLLNAALALELGTRPHRNGILLHDLFSNRSAREFLQVNKHEGVEYFNREHFETMISRLALLRAIFIFGDTTREPADCATAVQAMLQWAMTVQQEAENVGYKVATLLDWEQQQQSPPKAPNAKAKKPAKPKTTKRKS